MKKYVIFLLTVAFIFSVSANAQIKEDNKVQKRVEQMVSDLRLNDTEKASLTTLFEKHAGEMMKLKEEVNTDSAELKVKMRGLHKRQEVELKNLIGNEKYAELKEIRDQKMRKEALMK